MKGTRGPGRGRANLSIGLRLAAALGTLTASSSALAGEEGAVSPDAVLGRYWSPERDGQIEIYAKDGKYFGRLAWRESDVVDEKNPDPKLRNRSVIGQTFLTDFAFDGKDRWKNGKLYAFKKGKTVDGELWIEDGDLMVRGYMGLWILGRTMRLERVAADQIR